MTPEERYKQAVARISQLSPNDELSQTRNIYHGTNSLFDKFDFERGGGMVHFAEDRGKAAVYANDLGSGSRNRLKWKDIRIEDLDTGVNFFFDPDTKLWISSDGRERIPFEDFKEMMDEGERYFEAYPKNARVIQRQADMGKILDTYPNKQAPEYARANKKGLEAIIDIIDPNKIENNVNPDLTNVSQRYAARLRNSAIEELRAVPGAPGFGNEFWTMSKHVRSPEIKESLKGFTDQLKNSGFEGLRFQDDSHPTIAMFNDPSPPISIKKKGLGKLSKVLPVVGTTLGAIGALGYSDMAGAAVDAVIPGGVEELGADAEQRELDRRYKERIRQRALQE